VLFIFTDTDVPLSSCPDVSLVEFYRFSSRWTESPLWTGLWQEGGV